MGIEYNKSTKPTYQNVNSVKNAKTLTSTSVNKLKLLGYKLRKK